MQTWSLDHPQYGFIEVRVGFDRDFAAEEPDWPGDETEKEGALATAESSLRERIKLWADNPSERMEIRVGGVVQHRYNDVASARLPLFGEGDHNTLETPTGLGTDRNKPHLKLLASGLDELLSVEFREGPTVVEFDPPSGSRGARRREMMESSELRRALIPMAEGLGKGGWALTILILGPLVSRLLGWLAQLLPEWELPHIDLPVPDLPQMRLPLPHIDVPSPALPEAPEWVLWLAEYSKIWMPVVIGVVVGVLALRNHRRSEKEKAAWQHNQAAGTITPEERAD